MTNVSIMGLNGEISLLPAGSFALFDQAQAKLRNSKIAARRRRTLQLSDEFLHNTPEPIGMMRSARELFVEVKPLLTSIVPHQAQPIVLDR
jgi:hypothetical protein